MDRFFTVELLAQTPNPQQVIYAAMHQDYAEAFVWDERERFPSETRAGELIVRNLLAGGRGHYGPLEHPQITLNCGYFPHSTMQQMRTHRVGVSFDVQCLAADTEITFVHASGALRKIKIADLYDRWTNGETAIRRRKIRGRKGEPPGQYRRDCKTRLRKMNLRVLNEATGIFETSHIQEVFDKGMQPVYRLTLEDGRTLDCTENHRLLTQQGWQTMGDALHLLTDLTGQVVSHRQDCELLTNGVVVGESRVSIGAWTRTVAPQVHEKFDYVCQHCGQRGGQLHAHHLLPVCAHPEQAYSFDNLVSVCETCHRQIHNQGRELEFAQSFVPIQALPEKPKPIGHKLKAHPMRVVQVKYLGLQRTYDLEVAGDWHNFVANGVVVHNSFRYTGTRILDVANGKRDIEEVFYLRPLGSYTDRQGKRYDYTPELRQQDLEWCLAGCKRYQERIDQGFSEEHARGLIPFDVRQHWVLSANTRSLMHLLDLRWKGDAQLEAQQLCELIWTHFQAWVPEVAAWYESNRLKKARLAP